MPDRFTRSTSKGAARRITKGISWFKDSAHDHLAQMRDLAGILKENGHGVEQITTRRPGYIVYEDDHQIVAEPFSDTWNK